MQIGSKHWWSAVKWNGEKAAAIVAKCVQLVEYNCMRYTRWNEIHALCTTQRTAFARLCLHGVANKTYDSPMFDWYMAENWKHTNRFAIRACLQQIVLCHNEYTFVRVLAHSCTPINIAGLFSYGVFISISNHFNLIHSLSFAMLVARAHSAGRPYPSFCSHTSRTHILNQFNHLSAMERIPFDGDKY